MPRTNGNGASDNAFNPFMSNGRSHCYHLGESTLIIRDIGSDFEFLFHFL